MVAGQFWDGGGSGLVAEVGTIQYSATQSKTLFNYAYLSQGIISRHNVLCMPYVNFNVNNETILINV